MGEVYRGRDSTLGRDVALKVLPESLANDADYLARFRREAQVLASLNHPNIAAIYGLEGRAIVMELVEGRTLSDRMGQGPMPWEEAAGIARQIAVALEYAHEKGVVHRDLKPANVKITPDGVVKVLDFGLAKVAEHSVPQAIPENSPTLTFRATQLGMILGTAGYMAPEQARGEVTDRRADIWALWRGPLRDARQEDGLPRESDRGHSCLGVEAGTGLERAARWDTGPAGPTSSALPRQGSQAAAARHRRSAHRAGPSARYRSARGIGGARRTRPPVVGLGRNGLRFSRWWRGLLGRATSAPGRTEHSQPEIHTHHP